MTITVEAVYEGGVLKPVQPLPLKEHEKVTVTVAAEGAARFADLLHFAADLPDAPTDLSAQHDHYLYGTPRQ